MTTTTLSRHISRQFEEELENIRSAVMSMGGVVEHQLQSALGALEKQDRRLVEEAISAEGRTNEYEIALDEKCINLLVRRQPAAGDLRMMFGVIKIGTDLERVGDEAKKIAKQAHVLIESGNPADRYYERIIRMGDLAKSMLRDSLDAFARMDVEAAIRVTISETESDEQFKDVLALISSDIDEGGKDPEYVLAAIWIARALERIGDHARNICEYVIYSVEGVDIRHSDMETIHEQFGHLNDPETAPGGKDGSSPS